jgi:hypothetical protein
LTSHRAKKYTSTGRGNRCSSSRTYRAFAGASAATLTVDGVVHLQGLTGLKVLDLSGTGLSDAGLASLKDLARLKRLELMGNSVTNVAEALYWESWVYFAVGQYKKAKRILDDHLQAMADVSEPTDWLVSADELAACINAVDALHRFRQDPADDQWLLVRATIQSNQSSLVFELDKHHIRFQSTGTTQQVSNQSAVKRNDQKVLLDGFLDGQPWHANAIFYPSRTPGQEELAS